MKWLYWSAAILSAAMANGVRAGAPCSIATDNVNARQGPGTHYDVFFQAGRGYPIRTEKTSGEWVRFQDWEGDRAWVARRLVSTIPTAVILGNEVNVRRGGAQREPALAKVSRGQIYKVLKERNGWLRLGLYDSGKAIGWVRKDLTWVGCR